ncbi:MAG: SCO family protein [Sinobacteraceae bacterium]|nr:SCO family protein [Nevskiaceae bacterium]
MPQTWRDETGSVFNLHGLSGHTVVLTMAYASCHRICPVTMQRLQQLQGRFDAQHIQAEFVVVGYDPETDDAVTWRRYRHTRHLTRPNWHFLLGSPQQVSRFGHLLGFEFWKADEHVMHDGRILYLDPQGVLQPDPGPGVQQASLTE